jgi:hypothetical protein
MFEPHLEFGHPTDGFALKKEGLGHGNLDKVRVEIDRLIVKIGFKHSICGLQAELLPFVARDV